MPKAYLTLALVLAGICAVGGVILGFSPSRLVVECDRSARQCTISPQYLTSDGRRIGIDDLRELRVIGDDHPEIALVHAGERQIWTGKAADAGMADGFRRAVAELNAFPDGQAPTLRVEIPTTHRREVTAIAIGGSVFLLYFLFIATRFSRRTELRLDRAAGTASLRGTWFILRRPRVETWRLSEVKGVKLRMGRFVSLRFLPRGLIHVESSSRGSRQALSEWETKLNDFLAAR